MSLLRDMPITLVALDDSQLMTCSTNGPNIVSSANWINGTTGGQDPVNNTTSTGVQGRVIDRRRDHGDGLLSLYQVAIPQVNINSTIGSTEANRLIRLACLLQHGDSSGGGDQAPYSTQSAMFFSTQSQAFVQNITAYFSSARTSDMSNWSTAGSNIESTGPWRGVTRPMTYDLRGAKRYVSLAVWAAKNRVTSASSGDEGSHVTAQITFAAGDFERQIFDATSPLSSSTST